MKTKYILLAVALVVSLLTTTANVRAGQVSSPEVQRVGLVTAYAPGVSITIVDKDGAEFTFELASPLKVVPADRASSLGVGSYVTIIAPNNVPNGKHIAVGIVIHPGVPAGFPIPATATSVSTATSAPTETATAVPTQATTETETATAVETPTETATAVQTPVIGAPSSAHNSQTAVQTLVDWLASLFRQIMAKQSS